MEYISGKLNKACDKCGKRTELWEEELQNGERIRFCVQCISNMLASVIKTPKESKTEGVRP